MARTSTTENAASTGTELVLSLGSNCDQEENMAKAKLKLREMFGDDIVFSEQVWTCPIGIKSGMFLNCLVFTHTTDGLEHVNHEVKRIEAACGDMKEARGKNIVKMDIDILKYGGRILHESDWKREYVTRLMAACPFKGEDAGSAITR